MAVHVLLQDTVNYPVHLKNFNMGQLRQLCTELRSDIVQTVSKTGGGIYMPLILWITSVLDGTAAC